MRVVWPVPPPLTESVPEMDGVKVRAPLVGTMLTATVWPLAEAEVEVLKERAFWVVVEYPEPKVVVAPEYNRPEEPTLRVPTEREGR